MEEPSKKLTLTSIPNPILNFFVPIYNAKTPAEREQLTKAIKLRSSQVEKPFISVIHGTHMSIESRSEIRSDGYLTTSEAAAAAASHDRAAKKMLVEPITLLSNESVSMVSVVPGLSAADTCGYSPGALLFNGLNFKTLYEGKPTPIFNGVRRFPIDKFLAPLPPREPRDTSAPSREAFYENLRVNAMNFYATGKLGETIPNFFYAGEAPEVGSPFSSPLGMAVYVVIWRKGVVPEVFRVDMEVESKPSLRSKVFNTEFTTSELFHLLRRPEYSTFQIHHIISACQVFSTEIGKREMSQIKDMYVNQLRNIFAIKRHIDQEAGLHADEIAERAYLRLMEKGAKIKRAKIKREDSYQENWFNVREGDPGAVHHMEGSEDERLTEEDLTKFEMLPQIIIKEAEGEMTKLTPSLVINLREAWFETKQALYKDSLSGIATGGRSKKRRRRKTRKRHKMPRRGRTKRNNKRTKKSKKSRRV